VEVYELYLSSQRNVTPMSPRTLAARCFRRASWIAALPLLLALAAGGCVLGNDTDGPVLAVDLLWDLSPTDRFAAGSCEAAGVLFVTWRLKDGDGEVLQESDDDETCEESGDGFNFYGLYSGEYQLEVEGLDDQDAQRWEATCELALDRFDTLYRCRIEQEEPAESDEAEGADSDG
jgi:hypothetical protein